MARHLGFQGGDAASDDRLVEQLRNIARPLQQESDLSSLCERVGQAPFVLLGEASHGTSEFYSWRATISQKLIKEKDFAFIAVEGDWPECFMINRYIKGRLPSSLSTRQVLARFQRWPTWMWANEEMVEFVDWLKAHNSRLPEDKKVGFYGLDVYSLWESLYTLGDYLRKHEPHSLSAVEEVLQCFEHYGEDAQKYARASLLQEASCEQAIHQLLKRLQSRPLADDPGSLETQLETEQNAFVIQNAEAYYRSMIYGGPASWNIRDLHMAETLDRLMQHHGSRAKGIVWAHNTHIGDARFTDMADGGEINLGQLVRERYSQENSVLIGFASYKGKVIAGRAWDAPMQTMLVPEAQQGSWDELLHRASREDKLLIFSDLRDAEDLLDPRGQRAIGVVYRPEKEHLGNYVPTLLSRRYDALLFFEKTEALHPLPVPSRKERDAADTYPSTL